MEKLPLVVKAPHESSTPGCVCTCSLPPTPKRANSRSLVGHQAVSSHIKFLVVYRPWTRSSSWAGVRLSIVSFCAPSMKREDSKPQLLAVPRPHRTCATSMHLQKLLDPAANLSRWDFEQAMRLPKTKSLSQAENMGPKPANSRASSLLHATPGRCGESQAKQKKLLRLDRVGCSACPNVAQSVPWDD